MVESTVKCYGALSGPLAAARPRQVANVFHLFGLFLHFVKRVTVVTFPGFGRTISGFTEI